MPLGENLGFTLRDDLRSFFPACQGARDPISCMSDTDEILTSFNKFSMASMPATPF